MDMCKKNFVIALLMCLWGQSAFAQITFSAHANTALPLFEWRHAYKPNLGAGARFGYHFSDTWALKISGDYILFGGAQTRLLKVSKFPIQLNGEAHFKIGRFSPFAGAGAGITLHRSIAADFRSKKTFFSANAIGGISYSLSERTSLQFSSRFFWDKDSPMQMFSLGASMTL